MGCRQSIILLSGFHHFCLNSVMWQLHPVAHATRLDVPLNLPLKLWTTLIFPLGKERLNQKAHSFIFPDKLKPTNSSFTKSKARKRHPLSPSECYKSRASLSHDGPEPPVAKWKSNWDVNKGAGFRVVSAKLIFFVCSSNILSLAGYYVLHSFASVTISDCRTWRQSSVLEMVSSY